MVRATHILSPEPILALAERMTALATKMGSWRQHNSAADCRLAARYLQRLASLAIADEAQSERDPARKSQLEREATDLWKTSHFGRGGGMSACTPAELFPLLFGACLISAAFAYVIGYWERGRRR